jgi:hypothetical protein
MTVMKTPKSEHATRSVMAAPRLRCQTPPITSHSSTRGQPQPPQWQNRSPPPAKPTNSADGYLKCERYRAPRKTKPPAPNVPRPWPLWLKRLRDEPLLGRHATLRYFAPDCAFCHCPLGESRNRTERRIHAAEGFVLWRPARKSGVPGALAGCTLHQIAPINVLYSAQPQIYCSPIILMKDCSNL